MAELTAAFLKKIGEYMLVETPLARADACLLFGGEHADDLAKHAAKLYHRGYFGLVVVSGGVKTSKGFLEAHQMRDVLVANGVPQDIILVEDQATNSGENVKNSMALLDKTKGLENISSVIGIGQIHGSRRFLMTLERHWHAVTKMFTAPNYYPVSREDWHKDAEFRRCVLREFEKIAPYKAEDFIREVDMQVLAAKIAAIPRPRPSQGPNLKPPAGPKP